MSTNDLACWKCGASLDGLSLPLGRAAECGACGAELHVCRMCEFYDPRRQNQCREPMAEDVTDKTRANFCGYFQPRPGAYAAQDDAEARTARAALDALFGGGASGGGTMPRSSDDAKQAWERLFGGGKKES